VVLKVTALDRALDFHSTTLGLSEVARQDFGDGTMVFLSSGRNHHDIGLVEVASDARRPQGSDVGLYHVALKIGNDPDALRAAKTTLEERGVRSNGLRDHRVSQSLYVADPDGNNIELYVDADPDIGRNDPAAVATAVDLDL
jgi:catechol 2,3-dioxygenase